MRDALTILLHALIVWVLVEGLLSLTISSGAQSLWAIALSTTSVLALATWLTAWLTRSSQHGVPRLLRRLLPVPLLGAVWTGYAVASSEGTLPQVAVAASAWVVGALVGLLVVVLTRRRTEESSSMNQIFA